MPPVSLIVALSEAGPAPKGRLTLEHTILREGEWAHPKAPGGRLVIDRAMLGELEKNFKAGVGMAKDAVPFHVGHTEHQDDRAAAWAGVSVIPDAERPGKSKMVALARYTTPDDYERVRTGQYAFVSPTIDYGYQDRESGKSHKAVLRNVALTNYPFIKQMGPARVVNLSELAAERGDEATVVLADGFAAKGASNKGASKTSGANPNSDGAGNPNVAGLPDGYDPTDLPNQCRTCARLGNDCPFADDSADRDLGLKTAAAGSGNCPQYVEADGQTPGGGGQADAASASPAAGRAGDRVPMSENLTAVNLTTARATAAKTATARATTKGKMAMTPDKIRKLQDQVEAARAEKQDAFVVQLAETFKLPADSLKAVKAAFEGGHAASVALSELVDGQSVALSENEALYDAPAAVVAQVGRVDLSDSVLIGRGALRELLTDVASAGRTALTEADTHEVPGRPPAKGEGGGVALSEFEGLTPAETVAKVNAAAAAGRI